MLRTWSHIFLVLTSASFLVGCSISASLSGMDLPGFFTSISVQNVSHPVAFNSLTTSPNITWDLNSGTAVEYFYKIGSAPGDADVLPWTSVGLSTSVSNSSLALVEGQTYYVSVKAVDANGNSSNEVTSSGWLVDVTAPTSPGVPNDGVFQVDLTKTNLATWSSSTDSLSGISHYEIAIGSAPGLTDLQSWNSVGNVTSHQATGLTLLLGSTYYVSIRAHDLAGNFSSTSQSDGWIAGEYCSNKSSWLTYNAFGAGISADPFQICNAAQLANIGVLPAALSASYKLMGNIDLGPYYAAANPQFRIGTCGVGGCAVWEAGAFTFTGQFDGNNYTISNFNFVSPGTRGSAFFASLWSGADIKNLNLTNVNISGGHETGGLLGSAFASKVHKVTVTGTIVSNGESVGGIAGRGYHLVLGNSSFAGSVTSTNRYIGGAIGQMEESSLFSTRVSGSVSSSSSDVGGLAGQTRGSWASRISNSYSTASVSGTSSIGGLVGNLEAAQSKVINSYSTGNATGSGSNVGGLVGRVESGTTVVNSYSTGQVLGGDSSTTVGYLVGNSSGTISNSYYYSLASCDSSGAGGACGTVGSFHSTLNTFYNAANPPMSSWDSSPSLIDGADNFWTFDNLTHAKVWLETESSISVPFSGDGTSLNPYTIATATEFNKIGQNPRWLNQNFKLTANINFMSASFLQVGGSQVPFSGTFDGDNKTLSNVINNRPSEDAVGIFGIIAGQGRVSNFKVDTITISGKGIVGGFVGLLDASMLNNTTVTNGTVTATQDNAGGVFARSSKATAEDIGSNVNVVGTNNVGGVGGSVFAATTNRSFSKGTTSGVNNVGGVVGWMLAASFWNNYSTGNVISSGSKAGGLVGESMSGIYHSYTTSSVLGVAEVGGVVGNGSGITIEDVFATGNVLGSNGSTEVGVIAGVSAGATFTNAFYWSGASCDSTGSGGACNTNATAGVANVADFYISSNSPLSNWDFSSIWQTVPMAFPKLAFEP